MVKGPKLTDRQRRFVHALLGSAAGNGVKAAMATGCTRANAGTTACRWLKKVQVQAYKASREAKQDEKADATKADLVRMTLAIANDEGTKQADKLKAIEMLFKAGGHFSQRTVHEVDDVVLAMFRQGTPPTP